MSKADMLRENAANNKNIAVKCLSDVIKKKWKLWKFHRGAIAQNREPRSHVNRKFLNEKPFHVQFSLEWRKMSRKSISLSALAVLVRENSRLWWFEGMENMLGLENKQRCGWIITSTLFPMLSILKTWIISFILFDSGASIVLRLVLVRQTGENLRAETLESLCTVCDSSSQSVFLDADRFKPIKILNVGLWRLPICGVVRFHSPCCIKTIFHPWMAWLPTRFGDQANFSHLHPILANRRPRFCDQKN